MQTREVEVKVVVKGVEKTIYAHKVNNDSNGNPRYVVHFLSVTENHDDIYRDKLLKKYFSKYRAKWFGGGYICTTSSIKVHLQNYFDEISK